MKPISQKQRILLAVLSEMRKKNNSSRSSKTFLEKTLFLLKEEEGLDKLVKFYSFYPYDYGPFSQTSYEDIDRLKRAGLLTESLQVTQSGRAEIEKLPKSIEPNVKAVVGRFQSTESIRDYVYSKYPDYTVKSKLTANRQKKQNPGIFSIGYEGKDIDSFLDILIKNQIEAVVDIRFNPFSMNFDFLKSKLQKMLQKTEIEYVHIPELGIEGTKRKNLHAAEDYKRLFGEYKARIKASNSADIQKIIELGKKKRIVLLCFEHDKNLCHRGVVADQLEKEGMPVCHL
jgi:uncharacterized protein (DUF488 family)